MKVFLSSTAVDLEAHRLVADDTILRLFQQAVVMERFGPLPGEPVAECERKARECDVLVCVVAHRYGYVPEPGRGSITRREVEAARAAGRAVLVWIVADDHPWSEKKEQDRLTVPTVLADPEQVEKVIEGVQGLQEFKTWLRSNYGCDTFTTPDDLGRKIAVALSNYAREKTAGGQPAAAHAPSEIRIVHALQPAPHFLGREPLVDALNGWVADLASPDRVWALVAAGGTGKTAVVERVVATMAPGAANVLVWSFYERPDADAFLRECNQFFLGEEEGPAGGRLERLLRGLRDGRPHLIVLDGLERVQEEAGAGRVRGELTDHTIKLLLRALAVGQGRTRALVTSRFPLVDLEDWSSLGYRDTRLDDLSPEAAVSVLRGWGVLGTETTLAQAAAQVGHHALSVAVIGSYLRSFASGRIEAIAEFNLDAVTGDDPRAAKLARVLAFYAERLPAKELELLTRMAVFPRGVSLRLLRALVDAGGDVAGLLVNGHGRLGALLKSLKDRGLVFAYGTADGVSWTAHPFLRDRFRQLLGCPPERVFAVVADALGANLEKRPTTWPSEPAELDRYEQLIEATRLAGQELKAFELYSEGLGGYNNLARVLGEYGRGYRILAGFSSSGQPKDLAPMLHSAYRVPLVNALSLFALRLGRLAEAQALREVENGLARSLAFRARHGVWASRILNSNSVAFACGHLIEAHRLAGLALKQAELGHDVVRKRMSLCRRAYASHALGEMDSAEADFAAAALQSHALGEVNLPELDFAAITPPSHALGEVDSAEADFAAITLPSHALGGVDLPELDFAAITLPSHALGEVDFGDPDFAAVTQLEEGELPPLIGCAQQARHRLDLGDLAGASDLAYYGLIEAKKTKLNNYIPLFLQLIARLALAKGSDPTGYLEKIRAWTMRTGEMEWIITAHLLAARHLLCLGDSQGALAEVNNGLLHAESCGFVVLRIELLIALTRIRLAWPNPPAAIQAARLALDLATAPACGYAWGQADAFHVWGEAYAANNEPSLARRAFQRAIAVRKHIRHPGVEETKAWLALAS
jgi:hypothetical protein